MRKIIQTLLTFLVGYQVFTFMDRSIESRWRDYFPFNLVDHPPDEAFMTIKEIVEMNGYHYDEFIVKTQDGYLNTLMRVN